MVFKHNTQHQLNLSEVQINFNTDGYLKNVSNNEQVKWINFVIKNNSENRNHFVVKGPKSDGSKFGYGFPMMPNEERKEFWQVQHVWQVQKVWKI